MPKVCKICETCEKEIWRYSSQFHGARVYCSHKCRHEGQRRYFVGHLNPNYKNGVHCNDSICACGKVKDYRAKQCNLCYENIDKYFRKDTVRRNNILWRYIETYDLIPHRNCLLCGQGELWNGSKLVLQLDHIDGDGHNNEITNLRVLCPNCHTQTETYASKNKGKYAK